MSPRTMLTALGLEHLRNGEVLQKVNGALDDAVRDALHRPHVKGKRTVTVELVVQPSSSDELENQPRITATVKCVRVPADPSYSETVVPDGENLLVLGYQKEDSRQGTIEEFCHRRSVSE